MVGGGDSADAERANAEKEAESTLCLFTELLKMCSEDDKGETTRGTDGNN